MLIGNKITSLTIVDSTSNYVANLLKKDELEEGAVIMAYYQMNGRGQLSSKWQSEQGLNLTFSFFIRPVFVPLSQQFIISKFISIAIVKFLKEEFNCEAKIKWPNDILVDEKKICGVLIENTIKGTKIANSVIGIGLNVNQRQWQDGVEANSLSLIFDRDFDVVQVLKKLVIVLNNEYQKLIFSGSEEVEKEYMNYLYRYKIPGRFEDKTGFFNGQVTFVDSTGKIYIKTEDSELREYRPKEIKFIY